MTTTVTSSKKISVALLEEYWNKDDTVTVLSPEITEMLRKTETMEKLLQKNEDMSIFSQLGRFMTILFN